KATAAFRTYQDYVLKHMFVKVGQLDKVMVIHTAVALHPLLRPQLNDPSGMASILSDGEVNRAHTRFLFIHTGYPSHHVMASMVSQFPNISIDLSFFSHFPFVMEETLRTLLALVPPQKVLHGGDSGSIGEQLAYCAHNLRLSLAR